MIAEPAVKWSGGKRALLPEILERLPPKINTYYEPFFGGGAVFFALTTEKRFERAALNDVNSELMQMYATVACQADRVVAALKVYASSHSKEHYYYVRAQRPDKTDDPAVRAARFIYLNRTCFNGLYRVNRKGEFNVPMGSYANPKICDEDNLRAAAAILREAALCNLDFEVAVLGAKRGDAVYMDPPYHPVSDTANFTTYTPGGFGPEKHVRLRDVAKRLVNKNVRVLLSNSDTKFTRELYKDFRIETVEAPRRVNSKGDKRGNVKELLISGG